jgi:uncharacterized protein YidB (DUF937 family)
VPVQLERLRHSERCVVAVDGDGEDRMPVALLGVERMHADVLAEIEAVGPAGDFIAAVLLAHVDEDGVLRIGSKQGGAVAAGGRLKECFDRLGKSGERHGITSFVVGDANLSIRQNQIRHSIRIASILLGNRSVTFLDKQLG